MQTIDKGTSKDFSRPTFLSMPLSLRSSLARSLFLIASLMLRIDAVSAADDSITFRDIRPRDLVESALSHVESLHCYITRELRPGSTGKSGDYMLSVSYYRRSANGVWLVRREVIPDDQAPKPGQLKSVSIINADGQWWIGAKKAIRLPLEQSAKVSGGSLLVRAMANPRLVSASYHGSIEKRSGLNYFKIDAVLSDDQTRYLVSQASELARQTSVGPTELIRYVPVKVSYLVDPRLNFVIRESTTLSDGTERVAFDYKSVDFPKDIPDSLFEIPRGIEEELPKSMEEYSKLVTEALDGALN